MLQIEFSITILLFYTLRKCYKMKSFNNIFEFFSITFFQQRLVRIEKTKIKN